MNRSNVFIDVLIRLFENNFTEAIPFRFLCREIYYEEQIWKCPKVKNYQFGKKKRTACMYAAKCGNLERLQFLVKCKADLNICDSNNENVYDIAIQEGNIEIFKYLISLQDHTKLIKDNIVIENKRGNMLFYACEHHQYEIVKLLLQIGIECSEKIKDSVSRPWTPLMISCFTGNKRLVKILLNDKNSLRTLQFTDEDIFKKEDNDPLDEEEIETIEKSKPNDEIMLYIHGFSWTALEYAIFGLRNYVEMKDTKLEIIKLLLEAKADLRQNIPLLLCCQFQDYELADYFLKFGPIDLNHITFQSISNPVKRKIKEFPTLEKYFIQ